MPPAAETALAPGCTRELSSMAPYNGGVPIGAGASRSDSTAYNLFRGRSLKAGSNQDSP